MHTFLFLIRSASEYLEAVSSISSLKTHYAVEDELKIPVEWADFRLGYWL
jgi:hypothetical protein